MKHLLFSFFMLLSIATSAQSTSINVIGYFSGNAQQVEAIQTEKLSHIIFSFCHLKGNQLQVDSKNDSITIQKLVELKQKNVNLKILLSLGGWGGCASCSDVFSTAQSREEFALSTLALMKYFNVDGIDLDWEYPAIEGFPGHVFKKDDKGNFSALITILREVLGGRYEISFAAGGFKKYLEESVDWKTVAPLVDRVNLMSYDLVSGFATTTGHHTPLFSNGQTTESTDYAVKYMVAQGVPKNKIVIGGAFYARVWEQVPNINHGLYQPGKFKASIDFKKYGSELTEEKGFQSFWDNNAQAPYFYNKEQKLFATGDDRKSIRLKTQYAINQGLQGIMFWELTLDELTEGLLSEIDKVKNAR